MKTQTQCPLKDQRDLYRERSRLMKRIRQPLKHTYTRVCARIYTERQIHTKTRTHKDTLYKCSYTLPDIP